MPEFLTGFPFALVLASLSAGAWLRGQLLYWIGRIPTDQALRRTHPDHGWRKRIHDWLAAGGADAGIVAIRRWGLVAVPLCYVTVGFQSMVQAAAGVLRITWWKYALAQIPGALAWGTIYSTIGFAVWEAALAAAAGSPVGIGVIVVLVAAGVTALVMLRRRRDRVAAIPASGSVAGTQEAVGDDVPAADAALAPRHEHS
ncbi:VTT domain-containing protein [Ruania alkalisoli]|uniref:VTT domain-containing protein n=1 Tax=Ruania alkalisoli TaxID=2779775 RepID=A0A7M1SP26_9MICO|nr:VTT domain-containing protein [Ruania alkalisoli]QOR69225.1 VTT domain-containing protein [Ruania alkalisoli]